MRQIIATYKISTPIFISGSDQKIAETRSPSIKSELRFWWRAIYWKDFISVFETESVALVEMSLFESFLFGSATKGQAKFLIDSTHFTSENPHSLAGCGLDYLLGQGLTRRPAISNKGNNDKDKEIKIKLKLKNLVSTCEVDQLKNTLIALGTIGGLGSRSRRGFGSLSIQSLSLKSDGDSFEIDIPKNPAEMSLLFKSWKSSHDLPPFTAFSSQTRIDISKISNGDSDCLNLLDDIGKELLIYRSYGQANVNNQHIVCGEDAEQNFTHGNRNDHDLMLNFINGTSPESLPARTVFGLPHNYFYSSVFKKIKTELQNENPYWDDSRVKKEARKRSSVWFTLSENKRERRASPLFVHAHIFPDGSNAIFQGSFPAVFLRNGDNLVLKKFEDSIIVEYSGATEVDFSVITDYMDRFGERDNLL